MTKYLDGGTDIVDTDICFYGHLATQSCPQGIMAWNLGNMMSIHGGLVTACSVRVIVILLFQSTPL
jgi:hypothetical protein